MTLPAGAALGASTDPKQLIHGDPEVVKSVASFLKGEARKAQGWLRDVDSLDVAPWTGFAALAHKSARDEQTSKLTAYADRFERAAGVLEGFHGALRAGRSRREGRGVRRGRRQRVGRHRQGRCARRR